MAYFDGRRRKRSFNRRRRFRRGLRFRRRVRRYYRRRPIQALKRLSRSVALLRRAVPARPSRVMVNVPYCDINSYESTYAGKLSGAFAGRSFPLMGLNCPKYSDGSDRRLNFGRRSEVIALKYLTLRLLLCPPDFIGGAGIACDEATALSRQPLRIFWAFVLDRFPVEPATDRGATSLNGGNGMHGLIQENHYCPLAMSEKSRNRLTPSNLFSENQRRYHVLNSGNFLLTPFEDELSASSYNTLMAPMVKNKLNKIKLKKFKYNFKGLRVKFNDSLYSSGGSPGDQDETELQVVSNQIFFWIGTTPTRWHMDSDVGSDTLNTAGISTGWSADNVPWWHNGKGPNDDGDWSYETGVGATECLPFKFDLSYGFYDVGP